MSPNRRERMTIGVLAGWQVNDGTNPNRLLGASFRGVTARALERGCNMLLACGVAARAWAALCQAKKSGRNRVCAFVIRS